MVGSAGWISPVSAVDVPAPVGGPPSCTAADGSAAGLAGGAWGPPHGAASNPGPITMSCLMGMAPSSCLFADEIASYTIVQGRTEYGSARRPPPPFRWVSA